MGIRGRALKVSDQALTDFNGNGLSLVTIIDADSSGQYRISQSGTVFRVMPSLKGGDVDSWYDADWFEPAPIKSISD